METNKNIIVVGDIHGQFHEINQLIKDERPDIILACGDFGFWPGQVSLSKLELLDTKLYWCDGNHENHDKLNELTDNTRDQFEIIHNCFYMPRGSILNLNGKNILFVGGADSVDKEWRVKGSNWFPQEVILEKDWDYINKIEEKIDIVISHTAPNYFKVEALLGKPEEEGNRLLKVYDPSRKYLDKVFDKFQPSKWYFGHWHVANIDKYKECDWTVLDMCPYEKYCMEPSLTSWWTKL